MNVVGVYLRGTARLPLITGQCSFHSTPVNEGKKNFRKFLIGYQRGTVAFKRLYRNRERFNRLFPDVKLHDNGARPIGMWKSGKLERIPEMMPEIIVPDLTGFELKPYVSYRTPDVTQSEFTARDLFDEVYSDKMMKDFQEGVLDASGLSLQPSDQERLTPEEARRRARSVYTDVWER